MSYEIRHFHSVRRRLHVFGACRWTCPPFDCNDFLRQLVIEQQQRIMGITDPLAHHPARFGLRHE